MQVSQFKHHQAPFEQVIEPRFGVVSGRGGRVPGGPVECAVGGVGGVGDGGWCAVLKKYAYSEGFLVVVEELKRGRETKRDI